MSLFNYLYCLDCQRRAYSHNSTLRTCYEKNKDSIPLWNRDRLASFLEDHRGHSLRCHSEHMDVIDEQDGKERYAHEFEEDKT